MANVVKLTGARVAPTSKHAERINLRVDIKAGRILPFDSRLDGRGPYANASSWAADIYHPDKSPVKEHLLVPKAVRLVWGGIKNLLSGVTTVAHHNPYEASYSRLAFRFAY
jgi:hypothetical protein